MADCEIGVERSLLDNPDDIEMKIYLLPSNNECILRKPF